MFQRKLSKNSRSAVDLAASLVEERRGRRSLGVAAPPAFVRRSSREGEIGGPNRRVEWDVVGIDGEEIPPDAGGDGQGVEADMTVVDKERGCSGGGLAVNLMVED
jgi:hypothetical protein